MKQALVLPQCLRSIAPWRAEPHGPHDGLVAAWALGLLVAMSEPPAGAPALGGYRVIAQKILLQSILRRHMACCILPQQWDQMVPCHHMHWGLLIHPCNQN